MDYQFFREKGYFKFPPILQIEITQKCPLSCPQCYTQMENGILRYKVFYFTKKNE